MLSEKSVNVITEKVRDYPHRRSALMAALHERQSEEEWLSHDALEEVSDLLNVPAATVKGVATFYHMYRHIPMGRNIVQLCTNVACMVMGSDSLVELLKKEFGLEPGGTSEDGRFSLVIMECIGACGTAPAMLVNDDFHENLDETNIIKILNGYT
jgi:NADH-quinone oxidoreductase E subunit